VNIFLSLKRIFFFFFNERGESENGVAFPGVDYDYGCDLFQELGGYARDFAGHLDRSLHPRYLHLCHHKCLSPLTDSAECLEEFVQRDVD